MKKLFAIAMAAFMLLAMFTGCGASAKQEETVPAQQMPASSLEILENIWAKFAEDEKFSIYGGAFETHAEIMNNLAEGEQYEPASQPENYDMAYAEGLSYTLYIPVETIASIAEAATMTHSMNANTFSAGVIRLNADADVKALADTMRDVLKNNMWLCGMPEQLIVATIGDSYMLIGFGVNDAMNPFVAHFTEAYPQAEILHNEPIA